MRRKKHNLSQCVIEVFTLFLVLIIGFPIVNYAQTKQIGELLQKLKDETILVRKQAAEELADTQDSTVIEPLIAALQDSGVISVVVHNVPQILTVRGSAAYALGKIGNSKAAKPLIALLKDSLWDARGCATIALGKIGDAIAIVPLEQVLQNDPEPQVREAAKVSLEQIKKKQKEKAR